MRQVEIADNLDIGRPDHVKIIFGRRHARGTTTAVHTVIDRYTDGIVVNVNFKPGSSSTSKTAAPCGSKRW